MNKRELLVFAGQSNMMGAAVYPPKVSLDIKDSYEYKHKNKRLFGKGEFVLGKHPAGEFSYVNMEEAYAPNMTRGGASLLNEYIKNTYFCPAMCNIVDDEKKTTRSFSDFSEATMQNGASIAPILAYDWERLGGKSAYIHIAKGGVSIRHYFTDEMVKEYARRIEKHNAEFGTEFDTTLAERSRQAGAAEYFAEKVSDFFSEAEEKFSGEDTSCRGFYWIQGESDAGMATEEYLTMIEVLWDRLKSLGLTHFFMLRIDFFGNERIKNTMAAQEIFCKRNENCYMMSRALSFIPYTKVPMDVYIRTPDAPYHTGRDDAYGFGNPHINEEGFAIAAKRAAENMKRVLREGKEPLLEEEIVKDIKY